MKGWRGKLTLLLIAYFAGFATAIYTLAPAEENYDAAQGKTEHRACFGASVLKSDEFAKEFNSGMRKSLALARKATMKAGQYLKEKLFTQTTAQEGTAE